jgi:hypothetical protein
VEFAVRRLSDTRVGVADDFTIAGVVAVGHFRNVRDLTAVLVAAASEGVRPACGGIMCGCGSRKGEKEKELFHRSSSKARESVNQGVMKRKTRQELRGRDFMMISRRVTAYQPKPQFLPFELS